MKLDGHLVADWKKIPTHIQAMEAAVEALGAHEVLRCSAALSGYFGVQVGGRRRAEVRRRVCPSCGRLLLEGARHRLRAWVKASGLHGELPLARSIP